MLKITIPAFECYNENTNTFSSVKETTLTLEHSLVSLSKWEAKWGKPFLSKDNKTSAEVLDYIRCMTITQNVDPAVYANLNKKHIKQILEYIESPQTATWFGADKAHKKKNREVITSELIYYWMVAFNIPFECQKWHLNRLITLIRICDEKNAPPKKMSRHEILSQQSKLNAMRKRKYNTRG